MVNSQSTAPFLKSILARYLLCVFYGSQVGEMVLTPKCEIHEISVCSVYPFVDISQFSIHVLNLRSQNFLLCA